MPATIENGVLTPGVILETGPPLMEDGFLEAGLAQVVLPPAGWAGEIGDTLTVRIPGEAEAEVLELRADTNDDGTLNHPKDGGVQGGRAGATNQGIPLPRRNFGGLQEKKLVLKLSTAVHAGIELTNEKANLDIVSLGVQVIGPQMRAQAHKLNKQVANLLYTAPVLATIQCGSAEGNILDAIIEGNTVQDAFAVSPDDRVIVVGGNVTRRLLKTKSLQKVNEAGDNGALLRKAYIGELFGYRVYKSNIIPLDDALLMHRSAFIQTFYVPEIPPLWAGNPQAAGKFVNPAGIGFRYLRGASILDAAEYISMETWWGGSAFLESGETEHGAQYHDVVRRAVKLTLSGTALGGADANAGYKTTYNANVTLPA